MTKYAIFHRKTNGDIDYLHSPDVVLLVIEENCPEDRVYCMSRPITDEQVKALVGDSKIGYLGDDSGKDEEVRKALDMQEAFDQETSIN